MKGYKPYSRKYYTEQIKSLARYMMKKSSFLGMNMHDKVEGKKADNEAWRFGGEGSFSAESEDFYYRVWIRRKGLNEKKRGK